MSIAKGKVFITQEKLKELFNLHEDVEIISVEQVEEGYVDGFEFKIASKEPIGRLTIEASNWCNVRRQSVPREVVRPSAPIFISAEEVLQGCQCGNVSGVRYPLGRFVMCGGCNAPIHEEKIVTKCSCKSDYGAKIKKGAYVCKLCELHK